MKHAIAKLRDLNIAPRKVRLVAATIKNLPVQEAEAQLLYHPQRSSVPLLKLLRSAVANAVENQKLDPKTLVISKLLVDPAPFLKRSLPRAQGRATPIAKRRSHITLVVAPSEKTTKQRFVITTPKKEKKVAEKKTAPVSETTKKAPKGDDRSGGAPKKDAKPGVFKKVFQRKAI